MNSVSPPAIMKVPILFLVGLLTFKSCITEQAEDIDTNLTRFVADLWLEGATGVKIIWRHYSKKIAEAKDAIDHKKYYSEFMRCVKRKTLRVLDSSLSLDVIPIAEGVSLVKFETVDRSGNVIPYKNTSTWTEKDFGDFDWRTLALERVSQLLHTHVIKFDFDDDKTVEKVEQRGRRRHHMMTMMMFGIVSIGMVLIPMGFQFLAVLGGKALLLAKLALILASIQGLKKIASSPLNYGFYHHFSPYDHLDKRSNDALFSVYQASSKTRDELLSQMKREVDEKFVKDIWSPMVLQKKGKESRHFLTVGSNIDSHLEDITARPGEVQADYSLELPYNRLHFQSATPVV